MNDETDEVNESEAEAELNEDEGGDDLMTGEEEGADMG